MTPEKARLTVVCLSALYLFVCGQARALDLSAEETSEYRVKAVFLYRFADYVRWPDEDLVDATRSLTIGVLGKSPVADQLDVLVGEMKNRRSSKGLVVRRFETIEDLETCQILFISSSEQFQLDRVLEKTRDWPVLTVADTEGFAEKGVMVNFIDEDGKVRFEINRDAAERSSLHISSHLLRLARSLISTENPEEVRK